MRVHEEITPNNNVMKFVCDVTLTQGGVEFDKDSTASESPLAQVLLTIPFINKIFITANFVAIEKIDSIDWADVVDDLKEIINDHLEEDAILAPMKKAPISIYAEMTPNPAAMKFVSTTMLAPEIIEIKSKDKAAGVPLAVAIYKEYPFIEEIFIVDNYISLTKNDSEDWSLWAMDVRSFITHYIQAGGPIFEEFYEFTTEVPEHVTIKPQEEFSSVEQQIKAILDEYVQPAVANDGGNIELIEFDEETRTAKMLLQGACSGCPSSTATLKNGIEGILKQMLPDVVDNVEAVNG
ncbi:Fe-S cluster biogenesis protein NfuA, 4Fe-4S-binding domain [Algoriella xinjiangensis]|uniref:Fe-S cluster biogenesis protein NfuA, 4Fe-4S-binding domain n=2 Tax=Weeksellaceae TaxID=2762318 RepID=A0A1I4WHQ8_9FLAO|nr:MULTISPECIES: NifU family protein [Algoriella]MBO6213268.1 NifU family protein [Algoriella sp.]SFN12967.1 Fe-S cluster biogenesis protein NfuA, 4Fe-4S-binding domain [Algoriella xinjiangensis]VDH16925.1 Fe/S biogenesis protein NfuA [Algoriella xinjiangensis]